MRDLSRWIPLRVYWKDSRPWVDWGYLGERRFVEPFFAQTIASCVRHPADVLFRHQTPLDELSEIAGSLPGLRPAGFVFHMSRCGSTLLSQMLSASAQNTVLSEPGPIDDILRAHHRRPGITETQRVRWLQSMVGALAWRRHPNEQNVFIKFDCWHVMFLSLIQRAFPEVPWIFLYREPIEVMASAQKQLGGQMIPGVLEPGLFGWDADLVRQMPLYEYAARVLACLCGEALTQAKVGRGKLVNYRQLPTEVWPALMEYWNTRFSSGETERMFGAARWDAKNPVLPFEADSQAKQDAATQECRELARRWLDGVYQQLEAHRCAHGFASLRR